MRKPIETIAPAAPSGAARALASGPAPDVVIIGSGMGGATLAHALAPTGARIVILEKGRQLPASPLNRDVRAIFQRGVFRPAETWIDGAGAAFNPGNYYVRGGNSKFYGGVLLRYRVEDFDGIAHRDGDAPAWPFRYSELAPWYGRAERLFQVRGQAGVDPTEPSDIPAYAFPPVPDEPAIAAVRARLAASGLRPFSLPLGVDIDTWLSHGKTPWDAYPDARTGKMDAETCALIPALQSPNVSILDGAEVTRLLTGPDGRRIAAVEFEHDGETHRLTAGLVVLAAGAVRSSALLLASADSANPNGLANRSGQVGRNFMNHNASAMLAIDPRTVNDAVYQKTLGLNDFYLSDGKGGPPLGNVQLLGRVTAPILKANMRLVPEAVLARLSRHAVDWYLMAEDLPQPDSRVRVVGRQIHLDWRRSNMSAHDGLVRTMRERFRACGYPIVLSRPFDRRTPSHQCGTIRLGTDPAYAPVDPFGRAFDHPNLFVADASLLVTSAAVNPSLTVAALAWRIADHLARTDLRQPLSLETVA